MQERSVIGIIVLSCSSCHCFREVYLILMWLRLRQTVLLAHCPRNPSTEWHVPELEFELQSQCSGGKRSYIRYYCSLQVYLKPMMLYVYVLHMSRAVSFFFLVTLLSFFFGKGWKRQQYQKLSSPPPLYNPFIVWSHHWNLIPITARVAPSFPARVGGVEMTPGLGDKLRHAW